MLTPQPVRPLSASGWDGREQSYQVAGESFKSWRLVLVPELATWLRPPTAALCGPELPETFGNTHTIVHVVVLTLVISRVCVPHSVRDVSRQSLSSHLKERRGWFSLGHPSGRGDARFLGVGCAPPPHHLAETRSLSQAVSPWAPRLSSPLFLQGSEREP